MLMIRAGRSAMMSRSIARLSGSESGAGPFARRVRQLPAAKLRLTSTP